MRRRQIYAQRSQEANKAKHDQYTVEVEITEEFADKLKECSPFKITDNMIRKIPHKNKRGKK